MMAAGIGLRRTIAPHTCLTGGTRPSNNGGVKGHIGVRVGTHEWPLVAGLWERDHVREDAGARFVGGGGGSGTLVSDRTRGVISMSRIPRNGTIGEYTTSGAVVNASLVSGLNYPFGIAVSGSNLFVANSRHRHDWRIHHVGSGRERLADLGVE